MKLYVVTDGEYSDYRIEAIFSRERDANRYREHHNSSNKLEIFELDPPVPHTIGFLYRGTYNLTTNKSYLDRVTNEGKPFECSPMMTYRADLPFGVEFSFWADDADHAGELMAGKISRFLLGQDLAVGTESKLECDLDDDGNPLTKGEFVQYNVSYQMRGETIMCVAREKVK